MKNLTFYEFKQNSLLTEKRRNPNPISKVLKNRIVVFILLVAIFAGISVPLPFSGNGDSIFEKTGIVPQVSANSTYYNFNSGAFNFTLNASTVNLITQNDNWSNVPSLEGYKGNGLTSTEGVDPQTILGTEFPNNALPVSGSTQVNANKSNPDAYNSAGITEFDTGTYLSLGMQGKVQAESPYIVLYLNTTGRFNVRVNYNLTDIDAGSNNSVSPVALQYRVGETGLFTNIPEAFVADVTDGGVAGRVTSVSVTLPNVCFNQPKVQIRLITNDPPGQAEWIGVNNIAVSSITPTAANAGISGRALSPDGTPISRVPVYLYDPFGNIQTAQTNSFGIYSFSELPVGQTYIVEARSKRFVFSNSIQVVTLNDNVSEINFYAGTFESFRTIFPVRKE